MIAIASAEKELVITQLTLWGEGDLVSKTISVYAIVVDEKIPREIKQFFDDRIEIRNIFGTKCYIILEDDEHSPLNLLDEEFYRRVKRWLDTVSSNKVFSYKWKA